MRMAQVVMLTATLSAAPSMATDGVVTWSVEMPKRQINVGVDTTFDFFVNVSVTGENQGLASFCNIVAITKDELTPVPAFINGQPVWDWGERWLPYKSPATWGCGMVVDSGLTGGPGLGSEYHTLGYMGRDGWIDDVTATIGAWDPLRNEGDQWRGVHQWGVGLDSRKSALLVDPTGDYLINYGYWTVADFVAANGPGQYSITVIPVFASVLKAELDLNGLTSGVPDVAATTVGASMEFTVYVPEPGTLSLMAVATLLLRRRRPLLNRQ